MCTTFVYRCAYCNKIVESIVELEECPYCGFGAWWDKWQEIDTKGKKCQKKRCQKKI